VDDVIFAVEGDDESLGMQLSKEFGMRTAPFFIVKMPEQEEYQAVESYFKLRKMLKPFNTNTTDTKRLGIVRAPLCTQVDDL